MFKLHPRVKRIVKRIALLGCVTAIGALCTGGTAMASDVTAPAQGVHSVTEANISWEHIWDEYALSRYELQHYTGGTWRNVPLDSPTATSKVVYVADGRSHQFRVRAVDALGPGPWRTGEAFQAKVVESTSPLMDDVSADWIVESSPNYSGGSTLKEAEGFAFTAKRVWSNRAVNVATIGTRLPSAGRTTVVYKYGIIGGTITSYYSVVQKCDTCMRPYKRVLHQLHLGYPAAGSVTVTNGGVGDGFSDVDATVIYEAR